MLQYLKEGAFTEWNMPRKEKLHPPPSSAWIRLDSMAHWQCRCFNFVVIQLVSKSHLDMHKFISMIYSELKVGNLFSTKLADTWEEDGLQGSQRYRHCQTQREKETERNRQGMWSEMETDIQGHCSPCAVAWSIMTAINCSVWSCQLLATAQFSVEYVSFICFDGLQDFFIILKCLESLCFSLQLLLL